MEKIWQAAQGLQEELVAIRRDLHKHPETGWTEFRTASFVIKELEKVGLAAPQVTYMMHALRAKGMPVDVEATTIREAADEISKVLQR